MIIRVKVKPNSSKQSVENFGDNRYLVHVKSAPENNEANVELYYTTADSFGATLLAYSSEFGAGIGLRMVAKRKGFKLNQYGLFKKGKLIAGRTEQEIYHALGRPWKKPEKR